jgi:SAM-dependent methyltransferase
MLETDAHFWNKKYETNKTGWDIGYVSTPIKEYIDQLTNLETKILIPGCGNAWEGEYLLQNNFNNTHLIDISTEAIKKFKVRVPSFSSDKIFLEDFFTHDEKYDLIIEQTFLSAIHPSQRISYVKQMHQLLNPGGKLVGLIFNIPLNEDHPPYGGSETEYLALFSPLFHLRTLQTAKNSISPRLGNELFMILEKK